MRADMWVPFVRAAALLGRHRTANERARCTRRRSRRS